MKRHLLLTLTAALAACWAAAGILEPRATSGLVPDPCAPRLVRFETLPGRTEAVFARGGASFPITETIQTGPDGISVRFESAGEFLDIRLPWSGEMAGAAFRHEDRTRGEAADLAPDSPEPVRAEFWNRFLGSDLGTAMTGSPCTASWFDGSGGVGGATVSGGDAAFAFPGRETLTAPGPGMPLPNMAWGSPGCWHALRVMVAAFDLWLATCPGGQNPQICDLAEGAVTLAIAGVMQHCGIGM